MAGGPLGLGSPVIRRCYCAVPSAGSKQPVLGRSGFLLRACFGAPSPLPICSGALVLEGGQLMWPAPPLPAPAAPPPKKEETQEVTIPTATIVETAEEPKKKKVIKAKVAVEAKPE